MNYAGKAMWKRTEEGKKQRIYCMNQEKAKYKNILDGLGREGEGKRRM